MIAKIANKVRQLYQVANAKVFGRGAPVFHISTEQALNNSHTMNFNPSNILEGEPSMRDNQLVSASHDGMQVGVWECAPGRFRWNFSCDETAHILEGKATVTVGEQTVQLVPGSLVFFPVGTKSIWHVTETVKKVYFLHQPSPFVKRLMGA